PREPTIVPHRIGSIIIEKLPTKSLVKKTATIATAITRMVLIKSPIPTKTHDPLSKATAPLPTSEARATLAFSIRLKPNSPAASTPAATGTIYMLRLEAFKIVSQKALCLASPVIKGEIIAPGVTATTIAIATADSSLFQNSPILYFDNSSIIDKPPIDENETSFRF